MRAFVTGATGFIGRRLVDRLLETGAEVTAMARGREPAAPPAACLVNIALEDGPERLAEPMAGHDVVFHLAAKISFDPRSLPELLRVNGDGTRAVLAAARLAGVPRTVCVSSACTIGLSNRPDVVLDEDTPFDPRWEARNPYLRSKRLGEAYASEAVQAGQWVTVVNPTTVFGAGDRSLNSGTLLKQVAEARVLPVPPGGSNVVDVDDVVDGILAAAGHGRPGRRYILGGRNLAFREIIKRISSVVGRRPRLLTMRSAAKGPMMLGAWLVGQVAGSRLLTPQIVGDTFAYKFYSSRRAEVELGWRARRDFDRTLAAAWDYYRREGLIRAAVGATA
jgi:dihydroflavonol-4-reductase